MICSHCVEGRCEAGLCDECISGHYFNGTQCIAESRDYMKGLVYIGIPISCVVGLIIIILVLVLCCSFCRRCLRNRQEKWDDGLSDIERRLSCHSNQDYLDNPAFQESKKSRMGSKNSKPPGEKTARYMEKLFTGPSVPANYVPNGRGMDLPPSHYVTSVMTPNTSPYTSPYTSPDERTLDMTSNMTSPKRTSNMISPNVKPMTSLEETSPKRTSNITSSNVKSKDMTLEDVTSSYMTSVVPADETSPSETKQPPGPRIKICLTAPDILENFERDSGIQDTLSCDSEDPSRSRSESVVSTDDIVHLRKMLEGMSLSVKQPNPTQCDCEYDIMLGRVLHRCRGERSDDEYSLGDSYLSIIDESEPNSRAQSRKVSVASIEPPNASHSPLKSVQE